MCIAYGHVCVEADGIVMITGAGEEPAIAAAKVPAATIELAWTISPDENLMLTGTA